MYLTLYERFTSMRKPHLEIDREVLLELLSHLFLCLVSITLSISDKKRGVYKHCNNSKRSSDQLHQLQMWCWEYFHKTIKNDWLPNLHTPTPPAHIKPRCTIGSLKLSIRPLPQAVI